MSPSVSVESRTTMDEAEGPFLAVDPDETFDLLDQEVWAYLIDDGEWDGRS